MIVGGNLRFDLSALAPADFGGTGAGALRRDLSRLRDAAAQLDGSAAAPTTVLAGWDAFRAQLDNHHAAVLAEMPLSARLAYRRVLRPRYDAQHRWQIPAAMATP